MIQNILPSFLKFCCYSFCFPCIPTTQNKKYGLFFFYRKQISNQSKPHLCIHSRISLTLRHINESVTNCIRFLGTSLHLSSIFKAISGIRYSMSTSFRLELIEPSAREVYIFWTLFEREERGWGRVRRCKEKLVKPSETRSSQRSELKKTVDPHPLQQTVL